MGRRIALLRFVYFVAYTFLLFQVWSLKTGNILYTLTGHTSTVRCLAVCGNMYVNMPFKTLLAFLESFRDPETLLFELGDYMPELC